jgi:hypothetical protein
MHWFDNASLSRLVTFKILGSCQISILVLIAVETNPGKISVNRLSGIYNHLGADAALDGAGQNMDGYLRHFFYHFQQFGLSTNTNT